MEILGVDIGGSGIKGAPVDIESGQLTAPRFRVDTPQPATPGAMTRQLVKLVKHFGWKGPIGCGFPAIIRHGVSKSASNIHKKWIDRDVQARFSAATGCPVYVLNDADAAGLAELHFGAGKNRNGVVLLITIGTGLGSALFTNGHLVPNTEFGHVLLNGKKAEHYAADSARKAERLSWKKWGKRFNEYLHHMEFLLSPDLVILGGGASKKLDKFGRYLDIQAEVVAAELLNEAGTVGAAFYAHLGETNQKLSKKAS